MNAETSYYFNTFFNECWIERNSWMSIEECIPNFITLFSVRIDRQTWDKNKHFLSSFLHYNTGVFYIINTNNSIFVKKIGIVPLSLIFILTIRQKEMFFSTNMWLYVWRRACLRCYRHLINVLEKCIGT